MVDGNDWLQAQYSVLGSVLIEPSLVPKVIQLTRAADFSGPCQTIYNTMRRIFEKGSPVDVVSVAAALPQDYKDFLAQLMQVTPSAANIDYYISLCREQARVIAARGIGTRLSGAKDSEQIRKLLTEANGLMVDKPGLRITTMSDALSSFMTRHSGQVQYLTWPIGALNERLYAEPGDFIIMGGLPSSGKSAWSLQCAWHWAGKCKVGFFSLETSAEKLFDRQMAAVAKLSMDDIKRNNIKQQQWNDVCAMTTEITERNLELVPAAGMTPAEIRSVTMMRGYQIIIIDYLQLIQSAGGNRTEQVTNISLSLHSMAQDMGVTVVALSQLKRKNEDDTPDSSDLRESGQLEQDADIIMMLKLQNKDDPEGNRDLYITKNKEGTTGKVPLAFDGKHQTFSRAQRTGETISQIKSMARAEQKKRRQAEQNTQDLGQMTLLPKDTYVPFEE